MELPEGERIDLGNYQIKKLKMVLASRDSEIAALKSQIEEITRKLEEKIEALKKSVRFYQARAKITRKPREKPVVETTEKSQGVQETVSENSESPPISQ